MGSSPGLALEFDVAVRRARRQGQLPLDDLVALYAAMMQADQGSQNQPRQVDLTVVLHSLQILPPGLLAASKVRLVPSLAGYPAAVPTAGEAPGAFASATLPDGMLLAEAPHDVDSLLIWAWALCALAYEAGKAQGLLAQAGSLQTAPHNPAAALAFALGHDEATLTRAAKKSGGQLLDLLVRPRPLPRIDMHHHLGPAFGASAAAQKAEQMVAALAEQGLLQRPLHLWLGDTTLVDCLSPYSRELRPYLVAWSNQLGVPLSEPLGDDAVYGLAAALLRQDGRLWTERCQAERSVGIYHREARAAAGSRPLAFQIVDLGRIDTSLCDARLPPWQPHPAAPVVLCVEAHSSEQRAALLDQLIRLAGQRLVSVTLMGDAVGLGGAGEALAADIVIPDMLLRLEGGCAIPPTDGLSPHDFMGLVDRPVATGAVLSAGSLAVARQALGGGAEGIVPAALEVGTAATVDVLNRALYRGLLAPQVQLGWALITAAAPRAPMSLGVAAQTRARTAVALAVLRRLTGAVAAQRSTRAGGNLPKTERPRGLAWGLRV